LRQRFAILCLLPLLSAACMCAQSQANLPDAPLPVVAIAVHSAEVPQQASASGGGPQTSAPAPADSAAESADDKIVTVFPHPDDKRWYIAGQANIIFQAHPPFHSPYQGPNSLHAAGEYKTSLLGTFFTGIQPHRSLRYNTDFIVDIESAAGRGLSQAVGLAGFTNLDVVRNPNLGPAPYLARGEIHQTIGLTDEMAAAARSYESLATQVPVRRFEFRIGKMGLPDLFDINSVGSDSHLQFTNWTIDNNGAWDYAADTRGYTVATTLEYDDRNWSARYGLAAMPTVANGIDLDWALSRASGQNVEFELRRSFLKGREGSTRILSYVNHAHMGLYRDAVIAYLDGSDPTPEITHHEKFGAVKYGFGWNNEQDVTGSLRVFSRFGWNEGQHQSFVYTEDDETVLFGGDYNGSEWRRPNDKFGAAFVSNAIKKDHQNYLAYGGLGFLLGDGRLNYGRENILETYYTHHFRAGVFGSIQLSHIDHPGYNRDRGPVWVPGLRMHVDF
jgi:high affinity Mn2+ porin